MTPVPLNTLPTLSQILRNVAVGLAVSVVMLNLGAAMGILSGRGAFAGMLSAGIIAFITSAFGGTCIQGSGTTAPMSAVTATIFAFALEKLPNHVVGMTADQFMGLTIGMTAIFLILFSLFKAGRLIDFVPQLVISGFMSGIALLIWILQTKLLLGLGRAPLEGSIWMNVKVALVTFAIALAIPPLLRRLIPRIAGFIPGTLVALLTVSTATHVLGLPVSMLSITNYLTDTTALKELVIGQLPSDVPWQAILIALPFAIELAALCFLDTGLTSLIVDKMRGTKTRRNKELAAQGVATGLVGIVGGVPGAQSTVPSVLMIKEGATMRLAGMAAGGFVLLELMLLADYMNLIPRAVFAGILLKVGVNVFDTRPFMAYLRTLRKRRQGQKTRILGHKEIIILSGTVLLTAFVDLIIAVAIFTTAYHFYNRMRPSQKMVDYVPS